MMLNWSQYVDFMDIKEPITDYHKQKVIQTKRVQKMLAAILHFDLSISILIRFLGNNYTGEYRDSKSTIKALQVANCDTQVVKDLKRLLEVGCPNRMNASSTHKKNLDFYRYGNHSTILKNVQKTNLAMNKEDRNQFLIPLPLWLARFISNLHLTPQGLLSKPGKNDRLIWDVSFIPNWHATSINMMLTHETEPEIIYGDTFQRHLENIWNLRISYPQSDILLFYDDFKDSFRHCKYHPDVASAFAFIISQYLFIPLGGTFGSITSPSNFEPIARARVHLAEHLSDRRDLLKKYRHIIDKVKFSPEPTEGIEFVQAINDRIHQGIKNPRKTKYNMFVDDFRFAHTRDTIKHSMAASIEALHMVLGYPDATKRQEPLSLDKYFESTCLFERIQLGIAINTRNLSIKLTEKKRFAMLDEISH